jgi:hypothetical protein
MFGLRSHTEGIFYGVIFDIGAESIGVSIIESDRSKKLPIVIFSHRVHLRIPKLAPSTGEYTRHMREALFSASLILSRDGLEALRLHNNHARIGKILVTCTSPWSYTISRNVQYESEDEIKITRALVDDLVKSAESEITTQIQSEKDNAHDLFEVVERATVDVRINDYSIQNPVGLRGTTVSLAHITGLIPSDIIKAVYEVQEKIFPNVEIRAHTFLLVLYCVLRDLFPKTESLCIINVAPEATEFGIVEGGTLIESTTIPFGTSELVRQLTGSLKKTEIEIGSLLTLYESGSLEKTLREQLDKEFKFFAKKFEESMSEHFVTRRFPKTAFLLAPEPYSELFVTELTPFIRDVFHADQTLLTINTETLKEISFHESNDPYLSITSRFFHKLHACGEIDTP